MTKNRTTLTSLSGGSIFDFLNDAAREDAELLLAVRSALFKLRSGENKAGVDYAAGSDFAVASPLRLNDQQIVAVLIEQSGEIKGERLGKTASHADIFAVAPDPHDIIHAADE